MDTTQLTPGRQYFLQPLTTRNEAEQFILRLERDGMSFNFDDAPDEILAGNSDELLFTPAEASALRARVAELERLMGIEGPHGLAVACTNADGGRVYRVEWLLDDGSNDHDWFYHTDESLDGIDTMTEDERTRAKALEVGASTSMASGGHNCHITRLQ